MIGAVSCSTIKKFGPGQANDSAPFFSNVLNFRVLFFSAIVAEMVTEI